MSEHQAIRAVDIDEGTIEGMAIPFDGPWNGLDAFKTVFTRDTNYYLDWFPNGRPVLYAHGKDDHFRGTRIGQESKAEIRDGGVWVEAQLEKSRDYWERIVPLLDKQALYFSSGAAPALIRSTSDGVMQDWPAIEWTLTPQPANHYAQLSPKRQLEAMRALAPGVHQYIAALVDFDAMSQRETPKEQEAKSKEHDPITDLWIQTMAIRSGYND